MFDHNTTRALAPATVAIATLLLASGVATANSGNPAATSHAAAPADTTNAATTAPITLDPVAIEGIELGLPITGGSGCPAGTVSAVLSPDNTVLSILYDEYIAETREDQPTARKSCNVAVPMSIPPGYSVSIFRTDYRGFAYIPDDGWGRFQAEYFFAGSRGPRVSRRFSERFNDNFLLRDNVPLEVWSRCGDNTIARINSNIMARRPVRSRDQAIVAVDSMDISAEMEFYLRWRRC